MSDTAWNRIEPIVEAETVDAGLAAPLADPLWLLGRQWQIGELTAEDAGTPIAAAITTSAVPIKRVHVGKHERPFDPGMPLEAFVEPEPPAPPDLRLRLTAGRDLALALVAADLNAAATKLATFARATAVDDRTSAALLRVLGDRAIDAEIVAKTIHTDSVADVAKALDAAKRDAVVAVLDPWHQSYLARTGRTAPSAWQDEHGAYKFALSTQIENHDVYLSADRYLGGRLDWDDFSVHRVPREDGRTAAAPKPKTTVVLPTPLDFTGGPARRFFEIERGGASYGALAGAPPDVATALLVEMTLVFGGDWFVVPVPLAVGALGRIDKIVVTDAFGEPTTLAGRVRSDGWRMFEASADPALADYLVVLPTIASAFEGPVIESVGLATDEMANLVWASEDTLADPLGLPARVDHTRPRPPASDVPRYVPLLPPPPSWFPLVRNDGRFVGATLRALPAMRPRGRVLAGWPKVGFITNDVPLEGLRIERRWQFAVGTEGRRALWITRTDSIGRGGVTSGLAADQIVQP